MTLLSWLFICLVAIILAASFIAGIMYYQKNKRLNEKMNDENRRPHRYDDHFMND